MLTEPSCIAIAATFGNSICEFGRPERLRKRCLGTADISSNPIVQPQRGDICIAAGERGEHQASQA